MSIGSAGVVWYKDVQRIKLGVCVVCRVLRN